MKTNKTSIIIWFLTPFVLIPIGWFYVATFSTMISLDIALKMITSSNSIITHLIGIGLSLSFLLVYLKPAENWLNDPIPEDLVFVRKRLTTLPYLVLIIFFIYTIISIQVIMINDVYTEGASIQFLFTQNKFIIAELIGIPVFFIFTPVFFINFNLTLEKWAINIPLTEKSHFLSLREKVLILVVFTVVGCISFFIIFNSALIQSFANSNISEVSEFFIGRNILAGLLLLLLLVITMSVSSTSVFKPIIYIDNLLNQILKNVDEGETNLSIDFHIDDQISGRLPRRLNTFLKNLRSMIIGHQYENQLIN
jgi:hypothetical protein